MQKEKYIESIIPSKDCSKQPTSLEISQVSVEKSDSSIFHAVHSPDLVSESPKLEGICKEHHANLLSCDPKIKKDHKKHYWKTSDAPVDPLSENLKTNFPRFYKKEIDSILDSAVSDETMDIVCLISAYTVNNYFGSPSQKGADESELVSYLYRLTPLGTKKIKENLEKARSIQAPEFMLNVDIIEACSVQHNSSNKSGCPLCKVWVRNSRNYGVTEKGNHSTHPVWNSQFYLNVIDPKKDTLCIEMWDSNENYSLESETGGNSHYSSLFQRSFCCRRCWKQFPIGKVEIKVKDLLFDCTDKWLPVKSRKRKVERGKVHIVTHFGVVSPKNKVDAFKRHMLLLKVCVQDGLNQIIDQSTTVENLDELLQPSGHTLIHLHSVISSLTPCENSVSKFVVLNRIRTGNDSIPLKIMYQLLTETSDCLNQDCLADAVEIHLKDIFTKEVEILHNRCFNFLNSLHSFDLANDLTKVEEFKYCLKCIHVCEEVLIIKSAPLKTLKMEAFDWLESEEEKLNELEPLLRVEYLTEIFNNLIGFHKSADNVIQKIIPHETYTNITFAPLVDFCDPVENVVTSFVMSSLTSEKDSGDMDKGIELYSKIKDFVEYVLNVTKMSPSNWKMSTFQSWFDGKLIQAWLKRRKETAAHLMKNTVTYSYQKRWEGRVSEFQMDNSIEVVADIIDKYLTNLWQLVSHSELDDFHTLYLNAIHDYCLLYYETARSLIENHYLSQNFVRQYMLDLSNLANNLWKLSEAVKKCLLNTISELTPNAIQTEIVLKTLCKTVCKDISQLLMDELTESLNKIIMAETLEDQSLSIDAYEEYSASVIQCHLAPNMITEVYILLKQELWTKILDFSSEYMDKFKTENRFKTKYNDEKVFQVSQAIEKKDIFFRGLFKILTLSKHFCFTDEEDESLDFIENESYTKLVEELGKHVSYNK